MGPRQGLTSDFLGSCNTRTCRVRNYLAKSIFLSFLLMWSMKGTITLQLKQAELGRWGAGHPDYTFLHKKGTSNLSPGYTRDLVLDTTMTKKRAGNGKLIKTFFLQLLHVNSLCSYPESKKAILWFYQIITFSFVLDDTKFL